MVTVFVSSRTVPPFAISAQLLPQPDPWPPARRQGTGDVVPMVNVPDRADVTWGFVRSKVSLAMLFSLAFPR